MYIVKDILKSYLFPDKLIVTFNSFSSVLLNKEHEVSTVSGWPKDYQNFSMKYVFKKVKDLKIGDEVITY